MIIKWTEDINLSDNEVAIMKFLDTNKNHMYTWYSNDHTGKHPFELHECRGLVKNGFLTQGRDHNFGDEYVYFSSKGMKLSELINKERVT